MAISGHEIAHKAHPVHLFELLSNLTGVTPCLFVLSEKLISLFGHVSIHIPQLLHFSVSIIILGIITIIALN